MYKALQIRTGEEIIILSPRWRNQIDRLREMCREDLLICQGCCQPLRVKSGKKKRAHFAHKHLVACSYGIESQEILFARAVLYHWLEKQLGDAVTLEKKLERSNLPRPVDCWVTIGEVGHAYWLIESGIKPEPRKEILSAFDRPDVKAHWIFLKRMLNEEKKELHSLLLTTTERAFLYQSLYDKAEAGIADPGFSCHYLDAECESLITYRNLRMIHQPNWFRGIKRTSQLDEVRINSNDGEISHSGEIVRLRSFLQRQARTARKYHLYQEREESLQKYLPTQGAISAQARAEAISTFSDSIQELPCVECGQWTTNYWSTFVNETGRRVCRCRECLDRSVGRAGVLDS